MFDQGGLSPSALYALCQHARDKMTGVTVELSSNGLAENLAPGSLMYVNSLELLNAQGRKKVQTSSKDSHVVLVEAIMKTGAIVVINPDRALNTSRSGFTENQWGRMKIPRASLDRVWQSGRWDGMRTTGTAIHWVL